MSEEEKPKVQMFSILRFVVSIAPPVIVIVAVDLVVFLSLRFLSANLLSDTLFLEGGSFVAIGGILEALSSANVSKVKEDLFRQAAWTPERHKEAQYRAAKIIATGMLLILLAVAVRP